MSKRERIPRSLTQKLNALDDHLFIIREHLTKVNESTSHLKVISTELRNLLCKSSGTEGLLWRLADELNIDDKIFLHVPGDFNMEHPTAEGLQFAIIPIQRGGDGMSGLPPCHYSFKKIIKERQALLVSGKPYTHEYLIKALAQQMGTAHEDDALEQMLVDLQSNNVFGVEHHVSVLVTNSKLALEIGERVLEDAEKHKGYKRRYHNHNDGNISIATSLLVKQQILDNIPLFTFRSYISDHNISVSATPSGVEFLIRKHNLIVGGLEAKYPEDKVLGRHSVFVFSYSSRTMQARTIVDGEASDIINLKDISWLHASDFSIEGANNRHIDLIQGFYILCYETLLSSKRSKSLSELPANGDGLFIPSGEIVERGVFPE